MNFYQRLADWWPLFSAPEDYEEEAKIYGDLLEATCRGPVESLLELGCGGGNNALFMKQRFGHLTLTDLSSGMVDVSRNLNPECDHAVGDMRSLRLEKTFDAVFVHDAVCYMTTEDDLRRAIETAYVHCRPGGAALIAPDYVRETFRPDTESGGHDEPVEGAQLEPGESPRGLRYLAWVWDPDPADTSYLTEYSFLLRERDGSVTSEYERHVEGLFSRETFKGLLAETGFSNVRVVPLEHSEVDAGVHEMFVASKPDDSDV